jgi:hypothetical protein
VQRSSVFAIACILVGTFSAYGAAANKVVVGVNVMGVDQIGDAQQEALAQQLQDNGVKTIRTALGGHGDRYTSFVITAYRHGIGSVIVVSPFANNTAKHSLPADASAGHPWGLPALQDADPEGFGKWFVPELAQLEAAGVRVVAFEAGNEINSSPFNADFAVPGTGRVLGLADLENANDPEGRTVAASYRAYLKILATLKNLRDHSELNKTTPIISGTSAWWGALT